MTAWIQIPNTDATRGLEFESKGRRRGEVKRSADFPRFWVLYRIWLKDICIYLHYVWHDQVHLCLFDHFRTMITYGIHYVSKPDRKGRIQKNLVHISMGQTRHFTGQRRTRSEIGDKASRQDVAIID